MDKQPLTMEMIEELRGTWAPGAELHCPKCGAVIYDGSYFDEEWVSGDVFVVKATVGCDECEYDAVFTRKYEPSETDVEILV